LNQQRPPWQKRSQIFSQLALEAAEKNHVESDRSVMGIQTSSQNPTLIQHGFSQPLQELVD
jgi:hypothetical protein